MNDLWHIHGAPPWMAYAFLSGELRGLAGQSPEGVLSIWYAMKPGQHFWEILRPLPMRLDDTETSPLRCEKTVFRIEWDAHGLVYLRTEAA